MEFTRSAGSAYNLNQTCIFRLAKVLLEESDLTITEALEPQTNDRMNHEWSMDKMSFLLKAKKDLLYDDEEITLQQTLADSIDISHPDFDRQIAIVNLKRSFIVAVDLCNKCLMVWHQEELDRNQGTCNECTLIEETPEESEEEKLEELSEPEPSQITEQNQKI